MCYNEYGDKMKKIFIYYSLSGNGDEVANYLKDKNIDIRKVETKEKLPNNMILRILTGGFKAGIGYKDKLSDFNPNISKYDEIIIGSPIWNDHLSCPINAVLDKIDLVGKKTTFILYSGSGKSKKAIQKINNEYPHTKIIQIKEPKKNQATFKEYLKDL